MKDEKKTKRQLVEELVALRQRVAQLEASENKTRRAEAALRESEERFRSTFEHAAVGVAHLGVDGRLLQVNRRFCDIVGYQHDEITKLVFDDIVHPEDLQADITYKRRMLADEIQTCSRQARHLKKDGSTIWVVQTVSLVRDSSGTPQYFVAVIEDISDHKRMERELKDTKEHLENVFENSADGIGIVDEHGNFIKWNKMAAELYGYSSEELRGTPSFNLYADKNELDKMLKQLRRDSIVKAYTISMKRKDGKIVPFELSISLLKDSNNRTAGSVCVARSLEQQRNLQGQLLHAQKMEAIGTLAGGIAHDFNNVLQAVQGYAQLLLMGAGKKGKGSAELEEIVSAARRGAELVKRMLTFSRKVESKRQPLCLNNEVEQVRHLLARTIPKMIQIELCLADGLRVVNADPVQMQQMLMNLAINAKDAMPEGGRLVIETRNASLDEEYCKVHVGATPGEYVLLSMADNGHGMDRKTLTRIFEPFFTTKEFGKGTGLGLAVVYGIVKGHDGHIMCYSEPGEGTIFKIYLPVIERVAETAEARAEFSVRGGTEVILLVDDEQSVLRLGERILKSSGYTVLTAPDGEGALGIYRSQKELIHLVMLDLIMPGMGGKRCLEELIKVNPEVKVVIASGFSTDGGESTLMGAGARGYVSKPYEIRQMLRVVRDILDAH
jgi:two-component system cell cycle sensor histidine kinase/response regulator CckA